MKNRICNLLCVLLVVVFCFVITGCRENDPAIDPSDNSSSVDTGDASSSDSSSEESSSEEENPAEHVHVYTGTVHEATCAEGGYVEYVCKCGDTYIGNETQPTTHSYTSQVVEPVDTQPGYTLYTCRFCGLNYKDNYKWNSTSDATVFFNDAAFIGDSVTLALRNYNMSTGALGNATFLCQGSYSVGHAVSSDANRLMLSYQGKNMDPEDALKASGANKVFILLGMNDIALYGVDKSLENWATMVTRIRQENPNIQIYIQSGTPIYVAGQIGGLNNNRMDQYNERLKVFAQENNCIYIDIATPMKDSNNGLAKKYCSDEYVHLTAAACELWVNILKTAVKGG